MIGDQDHFMTNSAPQCDPLLQPITTAGGGHTVAGAPCVLECVLEPKTTRPLFRRTIRLGDVFNAYSVSV